MPGAMQTTLPYWTDAQMQSVHHMMNPRSIAVVGATERMQYGGRMLALALRARDRVRVYPVNPRYRTLLGVKCYPKLSELPEAPDVVGVVVPYHQVLEVLKESHARGAKSAMIISAGFADAQLGPVLMYGMGGVTVEIYRDVAFRVCPIDLGEAMRMIDQVKGSRLLRGFRGRPEADVPALAETLVRVSHLAVNLQGVLTELDINPLLALPRGQGVKAVDALAILEG